MSYLILNSCEFSSNGIVEWSEIRGHNEHLSSECPLNREKEYEKEGKTSRSAMG